MWVWIPGRSLTPFEEQTLGDWKAAIHVPVVRCLGATDSATRMAAVACLGSLPIDNAAAAAVAYVDDPESADVRKQTLSSFSQRSTLLTDEMLFKRLHDQDASIREMASLILKTRRSVSGTDRPGWIDLQSQARTARLGDSAAQEPDGRRPGHLADPALARPRRDGENHVDRGTCAAQVAVRPAQAGGDGPHRQVGSRAPGCEQGCPGAAGDDSRIAPPARLVEPESQGKLNVGQAFQPDV